MASSLKRTLIQNQNLTDSMTTPWMALDPNMDEIAFWLATSGVNAATTLDFKIEHSPDKLNAKDLVSFTQQVGSAATELKGITLPIMGFVRAVVTLAGSTKEAAVTAEMLYSEKG